MYIREWLTRCEYAVPTKDGRYDEECGKPAVARWTWDDGKNWLHVCEEHNALLEKENF